MPLPALIPLISAGASAIGSSINTALQAKAARDNTNMANRANRELAEYQYSKDLEMWNKTNEYNNPSNQMARLKAAGLNPNLIYGNGGGQTQAATMPKYQAPTMNYNYRPAVDPLAVIGAYQNFRLQAAQVKSAEAQANSASDWWLFKTTGADMDTRLKAIDYGWKGNDYSFNRHGPTPYQESQRAIQENMRRLGEENIGMMAKRGFNLDASTKLLNMNVDNFIAKMWAQIFGTVAGTVSRFK